MYFVHGASWLDVCFLACSCPWKILHYWIINLQHRNMHAVELVCLFSQARKVAQIFQYPNSQLSRLLMTLLVWAVIRPKCGDNWLFGEAESNFQLFFFGGGCWVMDLDCITWCHLVCILLRPLLYICSLVHCTSFRTPLLADTGDVNFQPDSAW